MERIHSFALRILQASWGIAIDLQANIRVEEIAPPDAIQAGVRTWLLVTARLSLDNVHYLTVGLHTISRELEEVLPDGEVIVDILRADYVPTDYQPEAMAPAIIGLVAEAFDLSEPNIGVAFDRQANRYRFTY